MSFLKTLTEKTKQVISGNTYAKTAETIQNRLQFRLNPIENTEHSDQFKERNIEFRLLGEKIEGAELHSIDQDDNRILQKLKVTQRDEADHSLTLENELGTTFLLMKLNEERSEYLVTINHPKNLYRLEPTLHSNQH